MAPSVLFIPLFFNNLTKGSNNQAMATPIKNGETIVRKVFKNFIMFHSLKIKVIA